MESKKQFREEALEFLKRERVAVIASIGKSGEPQAAVVNYVADDGFNLFFVTKKGFRKYENLTRNPEVGIVIGLEANDQRTLQMQGTVSEIDTASMMEIAKTIMEREFDLWPMLKMSAGRGGASDIVAFKVKVHWVRLMTHRSVLGHEQVEDFFHQIVGE